MELVYNISTFVSCQRDKLCLEIKIPVTVQVHKSRTGHNGISAQRRIDMIKELNGNTPQTGKDTFVAENATLVGEVFIGDNCSIWYGAVLRGDVGAIRIGNNCNIQDGAVLHSTLDCSETILGEYVSVGHNAVVHGAEIGNDVLVGMGAVVMDNAIVPDGTIIAAGAVVLSNSVLEPGIYAGIPARKVKEGSDAIKKMAHDNAARYLTYKEWYKD